jgi:hypothetical protein
MVFRTWDFNFGVWIFTLAVSKIETWKIIGRDFQDVGSQFWDLDFTPGASHDPGPGFFLAHDFQDMDGEPGDFTVSEGHGHPLVGTSFTKGEYSSLKWTAWQRAIEVKLEAQVKCNRVRFSCLPFTFGSQKMWFLSFFI